MELNREQIVKALECCAEGDCDGCPRYPFFGCTKANMAVALALIRELTVELDAMRGAANSYKMHYEAAKADTVREMQERLKARYKLPQSNEVSSISPFQLHECIDQTAKEMLEEG